MSEDCTAKNGWYDTSGCYADCSGSTPITKKNQEYRSYYCSSQSCSSYTVTDRREVTCSTGSTCPTSGCADTKTYYTGGCSGGSCYKNNQPCGDDGWGCQNSETRAYSEGYCTGSSCGQRWTQAQNCNNNNYCAPAGTSKYCSGSQSCTRTSYNYVDYGCSGGNCQETSRAPSGNCPPSDSCGNCQFGCNSATGECSTCAPCANNDGWYDAGSSYACCDGSSTRATCQEQEYRDYSQCQPCSYTVTSRQTVKSGQAACNLPPAGSCSGNTRTYYSSSGTCSGGTCSYAQQTENCPTAACSGDTAQAGGCSGGSCYMNNVENCNSRDNCANSGAPQRVCRDSATACDAQNRIFNDYTCSSGGCALASSGPSASCPTSYTNCLTCITSEDACLDGLTLRDYAASACSAGACSNNYADVTCQFGCKTQSGNDVCHADPCAPNPCTSPPQNFCASGNSLTTYGAAGTCTASPASSSGSTASCSYTSTSVNCNYGCLSLPGNDQCAANTPPSLNSVTLQSAYLTYARQGHSVSVSSSGNDPNNEQVRLRCGTSSGGADLCTSAYAGAGPSCSFSSSFSDSSDHTVYCFLEDSAGGISTTLSSVLSSDNSAPSVSISRSPAGAITPSTLVMLTATASDSRSGVRTINIVVDGYNAAQCFSSVCSYSFTPSYGNHTYYANSYDRVGNVAWAYDSVSYPGPGPNGNGTAPPAGTQPGEGTTPQPGPTPTPGTGGSPCSGNGDCYSGTCSSGSCTPSASPAPTPTPVPANNLPVIAGPISYTGACNAGSTITVKCTASDANQAANSLSVRAWAGECTGSNCFATRSWATGSGTTYLNGANMDAPNNGGTFTKQLTITSPVGTSIAATCQATDSLGGQSNWGDAYPICRVNNCQNPPILTVNSISPNPSRAGKVNITFTADRALPSQPYLLLKPGSQSSGTLTYEASFVSKNGNTYTFEIDINGNYVNGIADISVGGQYQEQGNQCDYSQIAQMTIDTQPPATSIRCPTLACSSRIYTPSASVSLACSDATGCSVTQFSVNSESWQTYTGTFVLSSNGRHTVKFRSNDTLGNLEQEKSQDINVYLPPCRVPAEEPTCFPSGRIEEEVRMKVAFDKTSVLKGARLNSRIYCFMRDKVTKQKTRECELDPYNLRIIIDPGTAKQKDYFNYYRSSSYYAYKPAYDYQDVQKFLSELANTTSGSYRIDNVQYSFSKNWILPIEKHIPVRDMRERHGSWQRAERAGLRKLHCHEQRACARCFIPRSRRHSAPHN